MRCDQVRELIALRSLGLLEAEDVRRLEALLTADNAAVEALREEQRLLEDLASLRKTSPVAVEVRDRVRQGVTSLRPDEIRRVNRFELLGALIAGTAAATALAGGLWQLSPAFERAGQLTRTLLHGVSTATATLLAESGSVLTSLTSSAHWVPFAVGSAFAGSAVLLAGLAAIVRRERRLVGIRHDGPHR